MPNFLLLSVFKDSVSDYVTFSSLFGRPLVIYLDTPHMHIFLTQSLKARLNNPETIKG